MARPGRDRGRKKDYTGRTGPVSQIGADKLKDKARRVGVWDMQWEEGCHRNKKGRSHGGVKGKADG